jgi:hypothetical protein
MGQVPEQTDKKLDGQTASVTTKKQNCPVSRAPWSRIQTATWMTALSAQIYEGTL